MRGGGQGARVARQSHKTGGRRTRRWGPRRRERRPRRRTPPSEAFAEAARRGGFPFLSGEVRFRILGDGERGQPLPRWFRGTRPAMGNGNVFPPSASFSRHFCSCGGPQCLVQRARQKLKFTPHWSRYLGRKLATSLEYMRVVEFLYEFGNFSNRNFECVCKPAGNG